MNEPTHVDLFSGIGGFALAARWAGFRTVAFCEIDKYCQKVLAKNSGVLSYPHTVGRIGWKNHERTFTSWRARPALIGDIFDFDGREFAGVDLITGGFPCQPFSVAGKRRGKEDNRHLWPEMLRVITEARPAWVLGENVPGIIPMELDNVLSDLEAIGYSTRPFTIPACAVDARHRRDRVWIICRRGTTDRGSNTYANGDGLEAVSNDAVLCEQTDHPRQSRHLCSVGVQAARWLPEPDVGRVAHGVSNRVDRLKGLGNAIVPQVAYEILREIYNVIKCE